MFTDFNLPTIGVTIGSVYTAVFSSTSSRVGAALGPEYNIYTGAVLGGDAYSGGQAFLSLANNNCPTGGASICDFNFRVSGTRDLVAAVPEPATWGMMIFGMGAVGFAMRRRKKVTMPKVYPV